MQNLRRSYKKKKIEKITVKNVCVSVALFSQGTIFYNAVNSDHCFVTLKKNFLLLEHESKHYALCRMKAGHTG